MEGPAALGFDFYDNNSPFTIIFISGLLSPAFSNAKILKCSKLNCYCLELRSHFRSEFRSTFTYSVCADDVKKFVEDHGIKKFVIGGYCFGARVAFEFAKKYPEMVQGLFSIEGSPGKFAYQATSEIIGLLGTFIDDTKEEANAKIEAFASKIENQDYARLVRHWSKFQFIEQEEPNTKIKWKVDMRLVHDSYFNWMQDDQNLKLDIDKEKLLFIFGAQTEMRLDLNEVYACFTNLTEKQIHVIEGCNHLIGHQVPDKLAELIDAFALRVLS